MTEPTPITARIEVDRAYTESRDRPVVIFKHSPRCSISAHLYGAYRQFVEERPAEDPALFTVIDVLQARAPSDELARRSGVRHESPQALLLVDGQVVWSASHWDVSVEALEAALAQTQA